MLIDWHTKRQENRNYLVIFKGLVKKTLKRKWNIYFPLLNCSWYFTLSSSFRIRFISLSCLPKSNLLRSLKVQSIWSKHRLSDSVVLLKYKISCLAQIKNTNTNTKVSTDCQIQLSCSNTKSCLPEIQSHCTELIKKIHYFFFEDSSNRRGEWNW